MIEIPYLNDHLIGESPRESLAKEYSELVRDLFFIEDNPSSYVVPVGFLLYTNVHPEFRSFMGRADSWEFLSSLTRDHFHIFSVRPKSENATLERYDEERVLNVAKAFGLGDVFLEPHLVLLDLKLADYHYEKNKSKRTYHIAIGKSFTVKIASRKAEEYVGAFRDALGGAVLKGWKDSDSPATVIADSINTTSFASSLREAAELLFNEDFAKKFAAIWVLLNWKWRRI
jgi:hypothetical protein